VYEEEVFSTNTAVWFSPDGNNIVYIKFNDTHVPVMELPIYGEPGNEQFQYPHRIHLHYPKVSAPNPIVSLWHVNLEKLENTVQAKSNLVEVPKKFQNPQLDHLITSVSFANNQEFVVMFMNRIQNQGILEKCSFDGEIKCTDVLQLNPTDSWVDFFKEPLYNPDGSKLIYIGSHQLKNSTDSYKQVLMLDLKTLELSPLGLGAFVVDDIVGWNKETNLVFFKGNIEGDSKVQHLFAVKAETGAEKVCLTCKIEKYNYFEVEMDKDGKRLALISLGPEIPRVDVMEIETGNLKGELEIFLI
jgi:dipeptidyl-peptidase-4